MCFFLRLDIEILVTFKNIELQPLWGEVCSSIHFVFPHFLEHCDFTVDDSSSSNNTVTSISSTDGSNSASESSSVPSVLFSRDDARRRIKRPAKRPAAAAVSSSSASTTAEAAAAVVTPAVQQQSSSQSPSMSSSLYEVITTTRTLYDNVWISSSGSLFEVAKPAKATTTTADVKKSKVSRTIYSQCTGAKI